MPSKLFQSIRLVLIAAALTACTLAQAPATEQSKEKKPAQTEPKVEQTAVQSTRPTDATLYAGTDTCVTCHDEIAKTHEKGPHGKTQLTGNTGPAFQGCEGCHGPGKVHAEAGGDTSKIISYKNLTKVESTGICLDCHSQHEEHANFKRSQHARNDVGCVDCHSIHRAKVQGALLKASQPQMCYGCHQKLKSDSSKVLHHRANEAPATCTNCHSVHGSKRQTKTGSGSRGRSDHSSKGEA